jgi:exosortase C (VPDSG-CTERM-specific)
MIGPSLDKSMSDLTDRPLSVQTKRFAVLGLVLTVAFGVPLWTLLRFSLKSDFFSYIPLVPIISGYLIGLQRSRLPRVTMPTWPGVASAAAAGVALLGVDGWLAHSGQSVDLSSYLALLTASYLFLLLAGAFYFFGVGLLSAISFPVAFLAFLIPPPMFLLDPTVAFFQHASAWTAVAMIKAAGTPVILENLDLRLPGIPLRVAPECSGIHSTMVLLMTSLLAGYMFLQSPWRRIVLVSVVVPLAILRNGFRIFVIGELCVHVGPQMIDSPIHHHGGPIFFALSLIPLFWLLVLLRKTDLTGDAIPPATSAVSTTL